MVRILTFLLAIVFLAAAATMLLTLGQTIHVAAFGWKLDAPAGVAGTAIALFLGAFGLLISLYKDFAAMRRRRVLRGVLKRREKGADALVEAASAFLRADYGKAEKLSQKASQLLDRDDVLRLFARPAAVTPTPATPALSDPAAVTASAPPEEPTPTAAPLNLAEEALDRDAAAARRVS